MDFTKAHCIPLLDANTIWQLSSKRVLLDVRAPAEYQQGHIPGALSLPLFDDQQRSEIGSVYKNSGSQDAMLRGLNLVGPRMGELSLAARRLCAEAGPEVLVHCWRGGLRSESMAWLFKIMGLQPSVLEGGYKAFRAMARSYFERPLPLIVVSGLTGAGKTEILHELNQMGEQTIDLERLASHRGSAFGSIGQPEQPTTEQFENDLFACLADCDFDRPIWIEDEGNRLGTVVVPPPLVGKIRNSPAIFVDVSSDSRIDRLVEEYGAFAGDRLVESIANIRKRLGPQHADEAVQAIDQGDIRRAIQIVLDYYDRTYLHAAKRMPRPIMQNFSGDGMTAAEIATGLLQHQDKLMRVP